VRDNFIAGNWKMHKTVDEAVSLAKELVESCTDVKHRVMIAPPFTALWGVRQVLQGTNILLGAQNMGPEESGAHTGEVSVLMLEDLGVKIVILGHSERRHNYGEPDELINKKVRLALSRDLDVILCVGERIEEREAGTTEAIVERQLRSGLDGVPAGGMKRVTIAYEPVWAIGTGKTATPEDAEAIHVYIRRLVAELYNEDAAQDLTIQYGGSVKPGNIRALMAMKNIDGALVGGASLTAETFLPIVKFDE
jgi:triosephosphate isomerase